jgi:hypothetical protein
MRVMGSWSRVTLRPSVWPAWLGSITHRRLRPRPVHRRHMAGAPPRRIRTGPADISRLMRKKIMTRCRMIGSVQQVAILRTSAAAVALAPLLAACGNTVGVNSPPVTTRTVTTTESPTTPLPRIVPKVSNCGIQKPTVKPTELIIFLTHLSPLPSSGQSRPSGSQPCRSTPRKGSPCPIRTAIIQPAASCGTFYTGSSTRAHRPTTALSCRARRDQQPGSVRHTRSPSPPATRSR